MPDSLEKAITGLEAFYDRWGGNLSNLACRAFLRELNRLRALRERDEKRWEIVREVEDSLWNLPGEAVEGQARRLREAREGK